MKRMMLCAVLLAACGPKAAPSGPKGFEPDPSYAALFHKGQTWTFTVDTADDELDDSSDTGEFKNVKDKFDADCTVTDVAAFDGGVASTIDCPDLAGRGGSADPLTGLWIADATGAYHPSDGALPAAGAKPTYTADDLRFASPPAARHSEEHDPQFGDDPTSEIDVSQQGGAWCWSWQVTAGDEGWATLCVAADGPVNGSFGWAGGSSHEATFTRAK
jgi:hypothetical protein